MAAATPGRLLTDSLEPETLSQTSAPARAEEKPSKILTNEATRPMLHLRTKTLSRRSLNHPRQWQLEPVWTLEIALVYLRLFWRGCQGQWVLRRLPL